MCAQLHASTCMASNTVPNMHVHIHIHTCTSTSTCTYTCTCTCICICTCICAFTYTYMYVHIWAQHNCSSCHALTHIVPLCAFGIQCSCCHTHTHMLHVNQIMLGTGHLLMCAWLPFPVSFQLSAGHSSTVCFYLMHLAFPVSSQPNVGHVTMSFYLMCIPFPVYFHARLHTELVI